MKNSLWGIISLTLLISAVSFSSQPGQARVASEALEEQSEGKKTRIDDNQDLQFTRSESDIGAAILLSSLRGFPIESHKYDIPALSYSAALQLQSLNQIPASQAAAEKGQVAHSSENLVAASASPISLIPSFIGPGRRGKITKNPECKKFVEKHLNEGMKFLEIAKNWNIKHPDYEISGSHVKGYKGWNLASNPR